MRFIVCMTMVVAKGYLDLIYDARKYACGTVSLRYVFAAFNGNIERT